MYMYESYMLYMYKKLNKYILYSTCVQYTLIFFLWIHTYFQIYTAVHHLVLPWYIYNIYLKKYKLDGTCSTMYTIKLLYNCTAEVRKKIILFFFYFYILFYFVDYLNNMKNDNMRYLHVSANCSCYFILFDFIVVALKSSLNRCCCCKAAVRVCMWMKSFILISCQTIPQQQD